jgi:sigma-B regulation protein RsbU (phosphoserine phosphatase)
MKILIAEDDAVSRKILEKTLTNWGYEVIVTKDGREAWDAYKNESTKVAVVDWMMPEIDGLELVRRIRKAATKDYTYVILLTAKGQKTDIVAGLEAGADDYVIKPFDHDELRSRLSVGERVLSLEEKLANNISALEEANEIMQKDVEAASQIQQSLLPENLTPNPRVKCEYEFIPCDKVGGDMLNVFEINSNHVGVYISDVSGHGVTAAMYAVAISRILSPIDNDSSICRYYDPASSEHKPVSPSRVISRLNDQLRIYRGNIYYATMIYGILNTSTLNFKYVRAGHTPLIIVHNGKATEYENDGNMPVGIDENATFNEYELNLQSGDRIYFHSDGLVQDSKYLNPKDQIILLMEKLEKVYKKDLKEGIKDIISNAMSCTPDSKPEDDMTILGMEIND